MPLSSGQILHCSSRRLKSISVSRRSNSIGNQLTSKIAGVDELIYPRAFVGDVVGRAAKWERHAGRIWHDGNEETC